MSKTYDITSAIIAWEMGTMSDVDEAMEFWQYLIDTGLAWQLQGAYGRTANSLIRNGVITPKEHQA